MWDGASCGKLHCVPHRAMEMCAEVGDVKEWYRNQSCGGVDVTGGQPVKES